SAALSCCALRASPLSALLLAAVLFSERLLCELPRDERGPSSADPFPPRFLPDLDERLLRCSPRCVSLRRPRVLCPPRLSPFFPALTELSRERRSSDSSPPANIWRRRPHRPSLLLSGTALTGAGVLGVMVATAAGSATLRSCRPATTASGSSARSASL